MYESSRMNGADHNVNRISGVKELWARKRCVEETEHKLDLGIPFCKFIFLFTR